MNEFDTRHGQDGEEAPIPALAALKRDQAPTRDLWPGIGSRIQARRIQRQRTPWFAAVGVAASLLLVLGATVGVQSLRGSHPEPLHAPASLAMLGTGRGMRDTDLQPVTSRLHPETRALVKANLKIVDSAETQIKRAIAADPNGAYLQNLLQTAHQQKEQLHVVLADAR
jgi:hypothetical protein